MTPHILALLYDWHNEHRLARQRADVTFYATQLPPGRVWVLGAGTGRVAVPLARSGRPVVAVDRDTARLERIPPTSGLRPWHGDIAHLPAAADPSAIAPYSTLQLVPPHALVSCMAGGARVLGPGGELWCDLSDSFRERQGHPRMRVLVAPCAELGGEVTEEQEVVVSPDHVTLQSWWSMNERTIATCTERWFHHPTPALVACAHQAGLGLRRQHQGYGTPETSHRRILVFGRGRSAP